MAARSEPRVVLVTGASSGIGRAIAERLAVADWHVWGGSRRMPGSVSTAVTPQRLQGQPPGTASFTPLPLDVTREESIEAALAAILGAEGRLDALVHAAGISVAGAVEDVSIAEAEHQLATNYFGAVRMIRAVLPAMRRQGSGRIVVIGSIGGLIGLPFLGHYSASKFALDGLVEALRYEVAPFGIQATVLHPGDIRTEISANQIEGRATGSGSAYLERFRSTIGLYDKAVEQARGPDVIARDVERLLARRRQPVRVISGTGSERAGVALKAALPRSWFEAIIARTYRL